ncbi:hypothetical protein CYMTET_48065 [Cymbomonas tetramitiformis]|uniref:Uncharacterized protein n=1 Tax=Cymbomonas tetramitiformis TaxID=36881 RepID=A0AAE0BUW4_9CHLO|nr:hypothetical protein CYMTET_48065 [Cymbomonas tetramitiformis]
MHIIKNLTDTVSDSLLGAYVNQKGLEILEKFVEDWFEGMESDRSGASPDWNWTHQNDSDDTRTRDAPEEGDRMGQVVAVCEIDVAGDTSILVKARWLRLDTEGKREEYAARNSIYGADNVSKGFYVEDPENPATAGWDNTEPFIAAQHIDSQVVVIKHPCMETAVVFDREVDFFDVVIDAYACERVLLHVMLKVIEDLHKGKQWAFDILSNSTIANERPLSLSEFVLSILVCRSPNPFV